MDDVVLTFEEKEKVLALQIKIMKWFNEHRDAIGGWVNKHPIEVYLQLDPNQDLMSDSVYDLFANTWVVGPKITSGDYDPYEDFKNIADEIRRQVVGADELLGELKRDVIDYEVIKKAISSIPKESKYLLLSKLKMKLLELEDDIEQLYSKRKEWVNLRRQASKPLTPEQAREDIELARKWRDTNALFKFISRYQYMKTIGDLEKLTDDGISDEEVDVIKGIVGR